MEKTQNINSRSFAGEKTTAKASFLQILKRKLGTPTGANNASILNRTLQFPLWGDKEGLPKINITPR